jgi:hypothetical protein
MKAMSYGGAWECAKLVLNGVNMPVSVTVAHVGSEKIASEIRAAVEHALADHEGDWHVSVIGSHATDRWQLKLEGPNLFERSYTLEGIAGEHRAEVIRALLMRMLAKRSA